MSALARAALSAAAGGGAPWAQCAAMLALGFVPAVVAGICSCAVSLVQAGGLRFVVPSFKLERIHPLVGVGRMLSREALGQALRALLAFASAAPVVGLGVRGFVPAAQGRVSAFGLAGATFRAALQGAAAVGVIGVAFGISEYALARRGWLRKLRMTFAEYKRDLKEQDGDPQVRGRRRALHRSLSRGDVRRLKEATFIVCNPRHVAIALLYAPPVTPIPRILVRAADDLAPKVRELAATNRVPTIENVSLARALYEEGRAGEVIPAAHYVAVAEVLAALMRCGSVAR